MDDSFKMKLNQAIEAIEQKNLMQAEILIKEAITECVDAPEGYNLMGILAEYHGDYIKAAKYYRVANALDPTYTPAVHNLTRVTRGQSRMKLHELDMRGSLKDDTDMNYYVEYDTSKIGHIKKRG